MESELYVGLSEVSPCEQTGPPSSLTSYTLKSDSSWVNATELDQYLWGTCGFDIGFPPLGFDSHVSEALLQFEFHTLLPFSNICAFRFNYILYFCTLLKRYLLRKLRNWKPEVSSEVFCFYNVSQNRDGWGNHSEFLCFRCTIQFSIIITDNFLTSKIKLKAEMFTCEKTSTY